MDVAFVIDHASQILITQKLNKLLFHNSLTSYKDITKLRRIVLKFETCLAFKLTEYLKIYPSPTCTTVTIHILYSPKINGTK